MRALLLLSLVLSGLGAVADDAESIFYSGSTNRPLAGTTCPSSAVRFNASFDANAVVTAATSLGGELDAIVCMWNAALWGYRFNSNPPRGMVLFFQ